MYHVTIRMSVVFFFLCPAGPSHVFFFMEALRRSGDLDQKSAELLHLGMRPVYSQSHVSGDRFLDVFVAPNVETTPIFFSMFKLEVGFKNKIISCGTGQP